MPAPTRVMRFCEVIGQAEAKAQLAAARTSGRIPHATLFLGPEGNGALPLALAYAQYLFCKQPLDGDSCGQCVSCRKMGGLQYADLYFSFPFFKKPSKEHTIADDYAREWREALLESPYMDIDHWVSLISEESRQLIIPVDEAGSIIRKVSLKGYEGPLKIMVIWMCELMRSDTANKLLKVLEEPPENTLFFLVAHNPENLLSTILSRTQVLRLPRLPDRTVAEELVQRGVPPERSGQIAHYASGNWWRAWQLASADTPEARLSEAFVEWMRLCYKRDLVHLNAWINRMHEQSRDLQKQFLAYALEQVRQNLVLNYAGPGLTRMNAEEAEFARKFSPFINDLNADDLTSELNRAHTDIGRNVHTKIVFADLSIRIHYLLNRVS